MNFHRISLLVLGITYMSVTTAQDAIRAQDLFNLGNYSEALKEYTALAKLDSSNSVFRQKMGQCYLKTNINPRAALPSENTLQTRGKSKTNWLFKCCATAMLHKSS